MPNKEPLSWSESIRKYWDGIADKFPEMGPPIRPLPEETEFLVDCIKDVPKGDMLILGATFENVEAGVMNGFNTYIPDFSNNMRNYLRNTCHEKIPKKYQHKIHVIDSNWLKLINIWRDHLERGERMKFFSLKGTLSLHSNEKPKVIAGDGNLAFLKSYECWNVLKGARELISEDGVVVFRVGVHEPETYERPPLIFPQQLVKRTKEKIAKYKNDVQKLKIEKEKVNREYCYNYFLPPYNFRVDYRKFNMRVDEWVEAGKISYEDGELVKKPLAKLGNFQVYVPRKKDLEDIFEESEFKIKKGPEDIVDCHMLSYCLTPD